MVLKNAISGPPFLTAPAKIAIFAIYVFWVFSPICVFCYMLKNVYKNNSLLSNPLTAWAIDGKMNEQAGVVEW